MKLGIVLNHSFSRYFLAHGYAVIFLHRSGSLKPFERHFKGDNPLEWFTASEDGEKVEFNCENILLLSYMHFCPRCPDGSLAESAHGLLPCSLLNERILFWIRWLMLTRSELWLPDYWQACECVWECALLGHDEVPLCSKTGVVTTCEAYSPHQVEQNRIEE